MKKLLLALALSLFATVAHAQCNGVFPNNTVCGNITGAGNLPRPTNPTAFLGAAGGLNGQIQYNNGGALGGFTMSGDCTIVTATGVITCTPITSSGISQPQARITLQSGIAVMTGSTTAANTVYVTPSGGGIIPIYNGTNFQPTTFAEVSQLTTDTTKSPAAVANNTNYDILCWIDTGPTNRCTRSVAWASNTSRGTGAGTAELTLINGIWVNAQAVTNGPAANRGTYMGSVHSNGTATIDYNLGGMASGGSAGSLGVWNMYNRAWAYAATIDNGVTYPYGATASVRQARASAGNQISVLVGLVEDAVQAVYQQRGDTPTVAGSFAATSIGYDSCTVPSSNISFTQTTAAAISIGSMRTVFDSMPTIGFHFYCAQEQGDGSNNITFNGGQFGTLSVKVWN